MEVDEENDEFENVNLIEEDVFYLRGKVYWGDSTKNWKRSVWRKAEEFEIKHGKILY